MIENYNKKKPSQYGHELIHQQAIAVQYPLVRKKENPSQDTLFVNGYSVLCTTSTLWKKIVLKLVGMLTGSKSIHVYSFQNCEEAFLFSHQLIFRFKLRNTKDIYTDFQQPEIKACNRTTSSSTNQAQRSVTRSLLILICAIDRYFNSHNFQQRGLEE